jgi:hypothetical protein
VFFNFKILDIKLVIHVKSKILFIIILIELDFIDTSSINSLKLKKNSQLSITEKMLKLIDLNYQINGMNLNIFYLKVEFNNGTNT